MKRLLARYQSPLLALGIAAVLTGWLLSGAGPEPRAAAPEAAQSTPGTPPAFAVRVVTPVSEPITRDIVLYGRTEPVRAVVLRAELEGRVLAVGAERGDRVRQGDVIARLDPRDLKAQLVEAEATVGQRELQYEAAQRLEVKQFQSQTAVAEARANLAAARARVARVQVALANTLVRAPFDGILQTRRAEVGDFVSEGDEVAHIIDVSPMLAAGFVTQRQLRFVGPGATGTAKLVTGETVPGRVRYVSARSDEATRTFRVELELPNEGRSLVAGVTAEIRIATPAIDAHLISPALLALDDSARIGVKTVTAGDRVDFHPVEVITSDSRGIWVTGLPSAPRVITVGQGFVRPGDPVKPVEERAGLAGTDSAAQRGRTGG